MRGGRLLLAGTSAIAGLLAAEGGLRLAPAGSALYLQAAPRALASPDFLHLMEPDPDGRILLRLRPRLDATFKGNRVRTGAEGFRGPALREGTHRIVGIGDSVMFGWGVEEEETYLRILEGRLARGRPDIEVVNMAVPGYNTVQEVALLERHVGSLRPAWVVLGFLGNDFEPPMTLFPPPGLLDRHSWLCRLVKVRAQGFTPEARTAWRRRAALGALHRLGVLSRERGFGVAAFLYAGRVTAAPSRMLRDHPEVHAACEREGFLVIEAREIFREAIAAGEIETSFDIWLSSKKPIDPHPSPLGHRIIARGIAEALGPRLREGPPPAP